MLRPMLTDKVVRIFFNLEEIKAKANIIMLPVLTKLAAASLQGDTSRLLAVQL